VIEEIAAEFDRGAQEFWGRPSDRGRPSSGSCARSGGSSSGAWRRAADSRPALGAALPSRPSFLRSPAGTVRLLPFSRGNSRPCVRNRRIPRVWSDHERLPIDLILRAELADTRPASHRGIPATRRCWSRWRPARGHDFARSARRSTIGRWTSREARRGLDGLPSVPRFGSRRARLPSVPSGPCREGSRDESPRNSWGGWRRRFARCTGAVSRISTCATGATSWWARTEARS
jgi:hypothetical protein